MSFGSLCTERFRRLLKVNQTRRLYIVCARITIVNDSRSAGRLYRTSIGFIFTSWEAGYERLRKVPPLHSLFLFSQIFQTKQSGVTTWGKNTHISFCSLHSAVAGEGSGVCKNFVSAPRQGPLARPEKYGRERSTFVSPVQVAVIDENGRQEQLETSSVATLESVYCSGYALSGTTR